MLARRSHTSPATLSSPWSPSIGTECDADDEGQSDCMSMSSDDAPRQRQLSVAIPTTERYSLRRPTLREILSNKSPAPWTLAALMAYLSNNHCLETLEFTMDAGRYKKHYNKMMTKAAEQHAPPSAKDALATRTLWERLISAYIRPNGSREVNIPSDVKDPLLKIDLTFAPPAPDLLIPAIAKVYELLEESVLVPFLESVAPRSIGGVNSSGDSPTSAVYPKEQLEAIIEPRNDMSQVPGRRLFRRSSPHSSASYDRAQSPVMSSSASSTTSSRRSPPETFAAVFSRHRFSSALASLPPTPPSGRPLSACPLGGNEVSYPGLTDDMEEPYSPSSPMTPSVGSFPQSLHRSSMGSASWKKMGRWSGWRSSKHSSRDFRDQSDPL